MENLYNKRKDSHKHKCFIPECPNSRLKTPEKVFVRVRKSLQRKWCEQVNIPYNKPKELFYCCEDHLNLEEDLENYFKWKWTGCSPMLKTTAILQYNKQNDPSPPSSGETTQLEDIIIQDTVNGRQFIKLKSSAKLHLTNTSDHPSSTENTMVCLRPCSACLSYGRDLEPLGDLTDIYSTLVPAENNLKDVTICWECVGALRRCARFRRQATRARDVLTMTSTTEERLASITDNSSSLSKLTNVNVAHVSIDSTQHSDEITDEVITAINEETNEQEVKHEPLQHEETLDAMNVNTETGAKKRKRNDVQNTDAMCVEMEVPDENLEEPLCEIQDVKIEMEDPLECFECRETSIKTASEEMESSSSLEFEETNKIKFIQRKKEVFLKINNYDYP